MILLNSNAEHIFWLGRYLTRTQYLCSLFPFQTSDDASQLCACILLTCF